MQVCDYATAIRTMGLNWNWYYYDYAYSGKVFQMLMNNYETYGTAALSPEVKFYTIAEVKELTGWSETTIQKLYNDPTFPATDFGRTKLVEAHALINYFSKRRTKQNSRYWR